MYWLGVESWSLLLVPGIVVSGRGTTPGVVTVRHVVNSEIQGKETALWRRFMKHLWVKGNYSIDWFGWHWEHVTSTGSGLSYRRLSSDQYNLV